jgi:Tol biopolymer transport system component
VKSLATGDDRELYRADRITGCAAAHRSDALFCTRTVGGDTDVVAASLDSGRVEPKGRLRGHRSVHQATSDDRTLILYDGSNGFVEWEIGTQNQRPVPSYDSRLLVTRNVPAPARGAPVPIRFSPDGGWVVYHDRDGSGRDGLYRVSTAGGEPQRLGDYPTGLPTSALTISGDGRRFIMHAPARDPQPSRDYWVLDNFLPVAGSGAAK